VWMLYLMMGWWMRREKILWMGVVESRDAKRNTYLFVPTSRF
jgi:hypothetical protein